MAFRPKKLPITPGIPSVPVQDTIPLSHERLIGRFVVAWAKLEGSLDDLIWHFLDVPLEYGRIITSRMEAATKLQTIKFLASTSFGRFSPDLLMKDYCDEIMEQINILREDRNMVIHGTWGRIAPRFVPMTLSLRI
jgi:hypothetical protein